MLLDAKFHENNCKFRVNHEKFTIFARNCWSAEAQKTRQSVFIHFVKRGKWMLNDKDSLC